MGLIYTARLYRARIGAILAVSGALLSLVTWCIEVVSLHQVDAILYHPVGNLMAVSLGWVLASLLTSVGILIDARQPFRSSCF
jgi:urea transporter